jgi:hypothetical protein
MLADETVPSEDDHKYRVHQPDVSSLYQSALKECWICTQIFEDVCKSCMEGNRFPQNSTPAEISKLNFEFTTQMEETGSLVGNFTIYELRESDMGDMALYIDGANLHSS